MHFTKRIKSKKFGKNNHLTKMIYDGLIEMSEPDKRFFTTTFPFSFIPLLKWKNTLFVELLKLQNTVLIKIYVVAL